MNNAEIMGGISHIKTEEHYSGSETKLTYFAAKEQKANARPKLVSHIENLDDYDTIFIGYPNWWSDLPMPLYSLFDEYDFLGKNIIPFCVHQSSGFSSTIETIKKLEPTATVMNGFSTNEQNALEVKDDIAKWLDGMGMK